MSVPQDLEHILKTANDVWPNLRGSRLFITGGTGFFGIWLLESLVWANQELGLGASAVVLTRDPVAFATRWPHLGRAPGLEFIQGDIRTFSFPEGSFSHVIHAATPASAKMNLEQPALMSEVILKGTQHVLDFAAQAGAERFLLTSSGAVYGKQPSEVTHMRDDFAGKPDTSAPGSAYGEGKRQAELLGMTQARTSKMEFVSARGFAFIGPHFPLDGSFALGNFIQDCIMNRPIKIAGDGTPYRSYLYAADLMIWLWTLLVHGKNCETYNVGSENDVTIAELASIVAQTLSSSHAVQIAKTPVPGKPPERYVPSTERARLELKLRETVDLPESIRRTAEWYRSLN